LSAASVVDDPHLDAEGPTILVAEDEVLVRMMIADELRASGFRVVEASNADEALVVLQSSCSVDLVLTDIRMPGSMDGLALAQLVRSKWPGIKVIFASGQPRQPDMVADAFFSKPYQPERVVDRIREILIHRQT